MSFRDTWLDELPPEGVPHPQCSAYPHAADTMPVPVIMLELPPSFYLDAGVDAALRNAMPDICIGQDGLMERLQRMADTPFERHGTYRPDSDPPPDDFASMSGGRHSLVDSTAARLSDAGWAVNIRASTGVYSFGMRDVLCAFIHGRLVKTDPPTSGIVGGQHDHDCHVMHRGIPTDDPSSSAGFDLIVPVEPWQITNALGWGSKLSAWLKAQADVPVEPEHGPMAGNKWDRKAKKHKALMTATQINYNALQIRRSIDKENDERERARAVLHRHGWKAMLAGVMEVRLMGVYGSMPPTGEK